MEFLGALFAMVVSGMVSLFFYKMDRKSYADISKKKIVWVSIVVGLATFFSAFLLIYMRGVNILTILLMVYIGLFVWSDTLTKTVYDIANYVMLALFLALFCLNKNFNLVTVAWCMVFVLMGYLKAYGSGDGYLLGVMALYMGCQNISGIYMVCVFIVSEIISLAFIHLPLFIIDRKRKKEVKFLATKRAFSPAILTGFMIINLLISKGVI